MTQFVGLLLISLYIIIYKPSGRDVWILPSKDVLRDFVPFARVMTGIGIMGYIELLIYKIAAFIAVFLPAPQFAALVSLYGLDDMFYILPVGVSIPFTTFLCNAAGAGDEKRLRELMKIVFKFGCCLFGVQLVIFLTFRDELIGFYTSDPEVVSVLKSLSMIWIFSYPADFGQVMLGGVIKALGKENYGTKMFLICYYCIGLPTALLLAFGFGLQAIGIWIGMAFGIYCVLFALGYQIYKTDIREQIQVIQERVRSQ